MPGEAPATPRLRVLLIAEAANPEWVSVPLVGWAMAHALREVADTHIVTQVRNRDAFLRAGLVEGRDFTAIDSEKVAARAYRLASLLRGGSGKGWTLVTALQSLTYPYFERLVWRRFGRAIRAGAFDVVHRLTPLSPTAGSPIAARCRRAGVPFVLGPLNGGLPWPKGFGAERRREREWLSYLRDLYRLLPGRDATYRAANAILVGSRHTASEVPARFADRVIYMPENGIDPARFNCTAAAAPDDVLRLCFIGRLVPYKGADMAVEAAAALLRAGRAHLDVIGDGPAMADLAALIAREGLESFVTLHGWVDHAAVQEVACRSSVFLFPSIREFGGGAVLEAMSLGLVPVVVDHGGPGELVAAGGGIAVPVGSRAEIVRQLGATLEELARDPRKVRRLGDGARSWALSRLTWKAKARAMLPIYRWAIRPEGPRPEPF